MKNEQTTKNNQLKEYRSKINSLELENDTLKRAVNSDGKPKKGFLIDTHWLYMRANKKTQF